MNYMDRDAMSIGRNDDGTEYAACWNACLTAVMDEPAVEAEPVVYAQWEDVSGPWGPVRCTNCKTMYARECTRWKTCPECGAKIR